MADMRCSLHQLTTRYVIKWCNFNAKYQNVPLKARSSTPLRAALAWSVNRHTIDRLSCRWPRRPRVKYQAIQRTAADHPGGSRPLTTDLFTGADPLSRPAQAEQSRIKRCRRQTSDDARDWATSDLTTQLAMLSHDVVCTLYKRTTKAATTHAIFTTTQHDN